MRTYNKSGALMTATDANIASYDTGWVACSDWTNQHLGTALGGNVVHNLNTPLRNLIVKVFISTNGTDGTIKEVFDSNQNRSDTVAKAYGFSALAVDDDNLIIQTAIDGITYINNDGNMPAIDIETWNYRIVVYKMDTVYSGVSMDYYETPYIACSDWTNRLLGTTAGANLTHNLNAPLSDLLVKIIISEDGTNEESFEVYTSNEATIAHLGITIFDDSNNVLAIQTGSNGILYIVSGGSGGVINTQNWYYKIKVYKLTAVPSANIFDLLRDADNDTKITVEESADEDIIRMSTAGTDRITILNDGKVGIGINSPDRKLDVRATEAVVAKFSSSNAAATYIDLITNADTQDAGIRFQMDSSTDKFIGIDKGLDAIVLGTGLSVVAPQITILNDGRVGIGTNPSAKLDVVDTSGGVGIYLEVKTASEMTNPSIRVKGYSPSYELIDKDGVQNWFFGLDDNDGNKLLIGRGYGPGQGIAPAIVIDTSDNVGIGRTDVSTSAAGTFIQPPGVDGSPGYIYSVKTYSGSRNVLLNYHSGSYVGGIDMTNVATAFATSSDRRRKENIIDTVNGLNILSKIHVCDFNFISDPEKIKTQGILAQELYEVYPCAVAVGGDDIKTKPWGIDYGRMTPLIIKSVQELEVKIEELKTENDELKTAVESLTVRIEALEKKQKS